MEQKKEEVNQKPLFEFVDTPKLFVLCEKCGEIIGQSMFKPGQIAETRTIFVRFKQEKTICIYNPNLCGRRILDLFATYCSKCEFEHFHAMEYEKIKEMEKQKF